MPRGERSELRGVEEGVSERDTRVSELRARLNRRRFQTSAQARSAAAP